MSFDPDDIGGTWPPPHEQEYVPTGTVISSVREGVTFTLSSTPAPRQYVRSWPMHNLVGHPVSELCHLAGLPELGDWVHDRTLPAHEPGTGRG